MLVDDIFHTILDKVPNGATFKSLLLTCKKFYDYYTVSPNTLTIGGIVASKKYWMLVDRFADHYSTRITKTGQICRCDDMRATEDIIRRHAHRHIWPWHLISERRDLSLDFIKDFHQKLQITSVSRYCRNLTVAFIRKNPHMSWSWPHLTANKAFTEQDIDGNPDLPWNPFVINPHFSYQRAAKISNYPINSYPHIPDKALAKMVRQSFNHCDFISMITSPIYDLKRLCKHSPDEAMDMILKHTDLINEVGWMTVSKHLPTRYLMRDDFPKQYINRRHLISKPDISVKTLLDYFTIEYIALHGRIRLSDYLDLPPHVQHCVSKNGNASYLAHHLANERK